MGYEEIKDITLDLVVTHICYACERSTCSGNRGQKEDNSAFKVAELLR